MANLIETCCVIYGNEDGLSRFRADADRTLKDQGIAYGTFDDVRADTWLFGMGVSETESETVQGTVLGMFDEHLKDGSGVIRIESEHLHSDFLWLCSLKRLVAGYDLSVASSSAEDDGEDVFDPECVFFL